MSDRSAWTDHLVYEWGMLRHAYESWLPIAGTDRPEEYAALETFLIHYRNLVAFLRPTEKEREHPDSLTAEDFTEQIYELNPNHLIKSIHKRLAHLTKTRTSGNEEWDCTNMLHSLKSAWDAFVADLDDPTIGQALRQAGELPPHQASGVSTTTTTTSSIFYSGGRFHFSTPTDPDE